MIVQIYYFNLHTVYILFIFFKIQYAEFLNIQIFDSLDITISGGINYVPGALGMDDGGWGDEKWGDLVIL
jgi:hypothetical protein